VVQERACELKKKKNRSCSTTQQNYKRPQFDTKHTQQLKCVRQRLETNHSRKINIIRLKVRPILHEKHVCR